MLGRPQWMPHDSDLQPVGTCLGAALLRRSGSRQAHMVRCQAALANSECRRDALGLMMLGAMLSAPSQNLLNPGEQLVFSLTPRLDIIFLLVPHRMLR